jgi:hypothetical protein
MTRSEAIAELLRPHSPLGPFQEPQEPDERQERWALTAGLDALEAMFDLAAHPPPESETGRLSSQAFAFEVARVLALLAAQHEDAFLDRARHLLSNCPARGTIIDALALMASETSRKLLVPLSSATDLSEDEAIRLADAYGEMDGPAGLKLLKQLQAQIPPQWEAAHREIEIAMQYAQAD